MSDATPPQMPEMVERVARAICRTMRAAGWLDQDVDGQPYTLDDEVENSWDHFIPEARAAIGAMREPSAEMLSAADGAEIAGYIAMIDATLGGLVSSPAVDDRSRDEKEKARQAEA